VKPGGKGVPGEAIGLTAESHKKSPLDNSTCRRQIERRSKVHLDLGFLSGPADGIKIIASFLFAAVCAQTMHKLLPPAALFVPDATILPAWNPSKRPLSALGSEGVGGEFR
jgi:hypothetical protein